jgi:heptosyltransferase-2
LKEKVNRGFDSAYDTCLPAGPVQHEVERNLAVALSLGARVEDRQLDILVTAKDREGAAQLLEDVRRGSKPIALGIGAASAGRHWPLRHYAQALKQLSQDHDLWPVIICSQQELADAQKLHALLGKRASIISGAPLRQVSGVLGSCELFIGNDSGCAHLAAAMNCKTLVISRHPAGGDPNHFNSPVRFAPWGAHVRVLQPAVGRGGCTSACNVCAPHCILNVSVNDVVLEASRLLDRPLIDTSKAIDPRMGRSSPALLHSQALTAARRTVELSHTSRDGSVL